MKRKLLFLLLVLLIVPNISCQKAAEKAAEEAIEKAIESEGTKEARVDVSEGKIKIKAKEEGQEYSMEIAAGGEVKMPKDIPGDIPVYPESKLLSSMKFGEEHTRLALETEDSSQEVFDYYLKRLKKEGWEIVQEMKMPPTYTIMAAKGDRAANLVLKQEEGKTTFSIGWSKEKE